MAAAAPAAVVAPCAGVGAGTTFGTTSVYFVPAGAVTPGVTFG